MTTIVGIYNKGKIYLAADSRMVTGSYVEDDLLKKIWFSEDKNFIFGVSGPLRSLQLMKDNFYIPFDEIKNCKNVRKIIVPHLRKIFEDEKWEGDLILGIKGFGLYNIDRGFSMVKVDKYSIGSGGNIANGILDFFKRFNVIIYDYEIYIKNIIEVCIAKDVFSGGSIDQLVLR